MKVLFLHGKDRNRSSIDEVKDSSNLCNKLSKARKAILKYSYLEVVSFFIHIHTHLSSRRFLHTAVNAELSFGMESISPGFLVETVSVCCAESIGQSPAIVQQQKQVDCY